MVCGLYLSKVVYRRKVRHPGLSLPTATGGGVGAASLGLKLGMLSRPMGITPSSVKEGPGPGATEEGGSSLGDEESVCLGLGPPLFTPNYPLCPSFICWIPTYDLVLMWSPLLRTVSNTPGLEVI